LTIAKMKDAKKPLPELFNTPISKAQPAAISRFWAPPSAVFTETLLYAGRSLSR
jgi:hypothetical protein